jgi:hypothetical protein
LLGQFSKSKSVTPQLLRLIHFLTQKKWVKTNTSQDEEGVNEVFEEKWEDITVKNIISLSEIEDFDGLVMP